MPLKSVGEKHVKSDLTPISTIYPESKTHPKLNDVKLNEIRRLNAEVLEERSSVIPAIWHSFVQIQIRPNQGLWIRTSTIEQKQNRKVSVLWDSASQQQFQILLQKRSNLSNCTRIRSNLHTSASDLRRILSAGVLHVKRTFWEVYFKADMRQQLKEMYYKHRACYLACRFFCSPTIQRHIVRCSTYAAESSSVICALINRVMIDSSNKLSSWRPGLAWAYFFWQWRTIFSDDSGWST